MNEELEKQLAKIIEKSIEGVEKTGEFVMDQAPELIQQFFMWHMASYIFFTLLGVIILVLGLWLTRLFSTPKNERSEARTYIKILGAYYDYHADKEVAGYLGTICSFVAAIIVILVNLYKVIYILIAPKLYLLEYFIDKI